MRSRNSLPLSLVFVVLLSIEPTSLVDVFFSSRLSLRHSSRFVSAALTNNTVDDGDPLITYSPAQSWHASNGPPCSTCLQPDSNLAYNGTWHDGTHIVPTIDADDATSTKDSDDTVSTTPPPPPTPSPASSPVAAASPPPTQTAAPPDNDGKDDDDDGQGDDDDHSGKGGGKGGDSGGDGGDSSGKGSHGRRALPTRSRQRRELRARADSDDTDGNPFFVPKLDSDDPGFVDTPVFAQFNFTGSAVYVFALVPQFLAAGNNTPTFVNVTSTLDSQPVAKFTHKGLPTFSDSSYNESVLVFSAAGLPEGFHSLTMNVGPDSVFLLDKIIYSQEDNFGNGGNDTQNAVSTPLPGPSQSISAGLPSASTTDTTSATAKSHNIATFAGAVGGSIGLLSLLAFSLAFSIYRRRQKSKRRDQQTRAARRGGDAASLSDSFHTDASEDGPPMQGPAPFVPRYFPGTVPAAPPAYTASSSSNNISDVTTSLLTPVTSPHTSVAWPIPRPSDSSNDHSYADRPPPTPPPGDDGYFAPPTFQVAISTPVPAILARFSNLTSSQASQSAGHSSFRLPFSLPSRRQSQSSLAARSHNRSSSNTPQLSRSNSTRSSLRRASASTQPLLSRPISREESEPISRHSLVPSRPPSSASETPPSIAPPAEVLEAEREREAEGPRTRYTGDSAV